jgi:phospholipase C
VAPPPGDLLGPGTRIPAIVISPYARRGYVDHNIYGFESILKLIRYRFGLPPLTTRDKYARNIARSFDFESKPNYDVPDLPDPPQVAGAACQVGAPVPDLGVQPLAERPKEHDLAALHTSGYLERLGFRYRAATPGRTFRHPSKLGLRP